MPADDLLDGIAWEVAESATDAVSAPSADLDALAWMPAVVPGTVASASALVGSGDGVETASIDDRDWWFRARFSSADASAAELVCDGLAGDARVWLNGVPAFESRDMFRSARADVAVGAGENELIIRFRSLDATDAPRRPRARWRVRRLAGSHLRWTRQTLLGRLEGTPPTAPPVGPFRPVRLNPDGAVRIVSRHLLAVPTPGGGGRVTARIVVRGPLDQPDPPVLDVGTARVGLDLARAGDDRWMLEGTADLEKVERWWPRSHGTQALTPVSLRIGDAVFDLGRVGFREVRVDTHAGGFRFVVNGVPVFVGGAVWLPADPVGLRGDRAAVEARVRTLAGANVAMLRVPGDTLYESDAFYDLCDELGILVWQDCPLAFSDPPADPDWEELVLAEARENLERIASHPSLALVSGGTEVAQQATYAGVSLAEGLPLLTDRLPEVVAAAAGAIPYLPTSPWGGDVVTRPDTGVSHYYGVGAYLRDPGDARRARPRFAAECLAFAVPPRRESVDRAFGGPAAAAHRPDWKRGVFRDAGASWDFEDVRDRYVAMLYGVDPLEVRRTDPDRYLEFGRAATAALVEGTFAEWRRAESGSGGGLVFTANDLVPGAGLGLLDSDGVPKSTWYALRRALAPVAVSVSDEGLNGLVAHVHNATPHPLAATLEAELLIRGEIASDRATREVHLDARSSGEVGVDGMFEGFRDLSWSHRFGPLTYDVVVVALRSREGDELGRVVHLPGGPALAVDPDLGLTASVERAGDGRAVLTLATRRTAHFVSVDAPGWRPDDSGFDLPPRRETRIVLTSDGSTDVLRGSVHVLNGDPVSFSAAPLDRKEPAP